jgi:hypothetical protein
VLSAARERIVRSLPSEALVLHVGATGPIFGRADWVLAATAYDDRGDVEGRERFGRRNWLTRDVCAREPWPFEDGRFAFAVCTSLAAMRDPVGVCAELSRVAKAGYVEVPTVEEELSAGVEGPWLGRAEHRWLADVVDGQLTFTAKSHALHADARVRVEGRWHARLTEEERVHGLLWEDRLPARERMVSADVLVEELSQRIRTRFEPSTAEVALREARRIGGIAGYAVGRGIGTLRGRE